MCPSGSCLFPLGSLSSDHCYLHSVQHPVLTETGGGGGLWSHGPPLSSHTTLQPRGCESNSSSGVLPPLTFGYSFFVGIFTEPPCHAKHC